MNNNYKIKVAISTNINYYKKTIPIITNSLLESGIDRSEIYIFCGGCDNEETTTYEGFLFYKLKYRSFDLTSLIAICEFELKSDYWFLLQDTCKVGPTFKQKMYDFPNNFPDKIAVKHHPSMNMGLYKYEYLIKNKDYILKAKLFGNTPDELNKNKTWTVHNEDYVLWKLAPQAECYSAMREVPRHLSSQVVDKKNWYEDSVPRITEYYPALDFYKNKANWYGRDQWVCKL